MKGFNRSLISRPLEIKKRRRLKGYFMYLRWNFEGSRLASVNRGNNGFEGDVLFSNPDSWARRLFFVRIWMDHLFFARHWFEETNAPEGFGGDAATFYGGAVIDGLPNFNGGGNFIASGDCSFFSEGRLAEENQKIPAAEDDLLHFVYCGRRAFHIAVAGILPLCCMDFMRACVFLAWRLFPACQQ
ncbi:MAG: hypothetical protein SPF51_07140 [Candidatus Fimivicinus sp.]|nr:hypothetical protein [Oscillospiraceae bacterium]MDY5591305.1 hypothetical protein [Candidatus Fimivicinus sp.]